MEENGEDNHTHLFYRLMWVQIDVGRAMDKTRSLWLRNILSLLFPLPYSWGRQQWPIQVSTEFIKRLSEAERRGERTEDSKIGFTQNSHKKKCKYALEEGEKTASDWWQQVKITVIVTLNVIHYFPECSVLGQCVFGGPDPFPNSATHSSPQI